MFIFCRQYIVALKKDFFITVPRDSYVKLKRASKPMLPCKRNFTLIFILRLKQK